MRRRAAARTSSAASPATSRRRQAGGTNQMPSSSPAIVPAGIAASHRPTAEPESPRCATYGAASDSGATEQTGTSQPSSSTRRTRGCAEHGRHARERVAEQVRRAGAASPSAGRPRVARRTTSAEPPKLAQSTSERAARRGERDQQPADAVADDLRRLRDDAEERAPRDERARREDEHEQARCGCPRPRARSGRARRSARAGPARARSRPPSARRRPPRAGRTRPSGGAAARGRRGPRAARR